MFLSREESQHGCSPKKLFFQYQKGAAEYDVGDVENQYATWLGQDAIGTTSDRAQRS